MMELSRSRLGLPAAQPCPTWLPQCLPLTDPVDLDFCVYRGDTGFFMIIVTDAAGGPIDVTAAAWDADVRGSHDDAPLAYMVVTPHPGQAHIVDVVLPHDQSARLNGGTYVYDVEMYLNGAVTTLVAGKLEVRKDVSRS